MHKILIPFFNPLILNTMLAINEQLHERYRIIRRLGEGGMGAVYEAEDTKRFGKLVALKEILIDLAKAPTTKQQEILKRAFEREAKILTQLDYEAFPQVIDYFTETDSQYLVMELVQGDDLDHQLRKRQKPFTLEEVLNLANQLLEALDYLHTLNTPIFHRDIKPQNIKITARGKIKLLDFGIAKDSDSHLNTTVTNQTFIAATLNYSPFEQIFRVLDEHYREYLIEKYNLVKGNVLEQNVDAQSDIYALGATLYHLITGQIPVDALKRSLEVWSNKSDLLPAPISFSEEIPIEISNWILKSMSLKHQDRFASASEMQKALQKAIDSEKLHKAEESKKQELLKEQKWLEEQEILRKEREKIEADRRNVEEAKLLHLKQVEELQHQTRIKKQQFREAEERANKVEERLSKQLETEIADAEPSITQPSFPASSVTDSSYPIDSAFSTVAITESCLTEPRYLPKEFNADLIKEEPRFEITRPIENAELKAEEKPIWLIPLGAVALLMVIVAAGGMWLMFGKTDSSNNVQNINAILKSNQTANNLVKSDNNTNATQYSLSAKEYFKLGEECTQNKDYDCAIESYSKSIKLNSKNASAFNNRGIAYFNKLDLSSAIADYTKAIELKPQNVVFYQNRLKAYEKQGDLAAAENERLIIKKLQGEN